MVGLEVAKKAGQIAGTVLMVTGVGAAVVRVGARVGAGEAGAGGAAEQATAEAYLKWYSSKNPGLADDLGRSG